MIMPECGCFYVEFEEEKCFCVEFEKESQFCVEFGEIIMVEHGFNPYEGPYEVTPLAFIEQKLPTKDKNMLDDVTVFEIPYDEVSNPTGTTVVIAS